jgi:hypothetical protein
MVMLLLLPDALQLVLQPRARERVERAEGLVQQQHARPVHQPARNGHALRHAAGNLVRPRALEAFQADQRHMLGHQLGFSLRCRARCAGPRRCSAPP